MSLERLCSVLLKDLGLKRRGGGVHKRRIYVEDSTTSLKWWYFVSHCFLHFSSFPISFPPPPYTLPSSLLSLFTPPPRYVNAVALNSLWMNVREFLRVTSWKKPSTQLERLMFLSGNEWVDNLWHQWPVQWTLP